MLDIFVRNCEFQFYLSFQLSVPINVGILEMKAILVPSGSSTAIYHTVGQALFGSLAADFFALHLQILALIHFMQLRRVAFGTREPVPQARFNLFARR